MPNEPSGASAHEPHALPSEAEVRGVADRVAAGLRKPSRSRDPQTMSGLRQELQALRWRLLQGTQALRNSGPLGVDAQRTIGEASSWLARLAAIEFCVAEQFEGKSRPLYPAPLQPDDLHFRQAETLDRFIESLNLLVGTGVQSEEARAAGLHPDTRLRTSVFLGHAHAAYRVLLAQARPGRSTFLDVGCGLGQKVLLARHFFDQADGVELDEGYAAASKKLFSHMQSQARVFEEDALEFNGYGEYRLVYFFKPMQDQDGLLRLEERIVQGVQPGTVLIAPYSDFADRAEAYGVHPIDGSVYLAGGSSDDAVALREEAERIGTFVAHGRPPIMVDAVWQELVMASWMRGYNPFP